MASSSAQGTVALVTGGTRGIGLEVARGLARRGATVLVAARDETLGAEVVTELLHLGAAEASFHRADLSRQREVRELAATVRGERDRLHVLANVAGTVQGRRVLTEDGVETTVAVNLLAPFLLAVELAPLLAASAPSRIVNVSSAAQRRADLDLAELGDPGPRYTWSDAYASSKLALTVLTAEQALRFGPLGVTANAVHPGFIPGTDLARGMPWFLRLGWGLLDALPVPSKTTVAEGGKAVLEVATGPLGGDVTGRYVAEGVARDPPPQGQDPVVRGALWSWCARATGVDPDVPPAQEPATDGANL